MGLTDVIGRDGFKFLGAITVTRTALGTDDGHGRYVAGATSTFTLGDASVQPIGSTLKVMPEGYSAEDGRLIFTTTKLVKLPIPDILTIDGEDFAVFTVDGPWTAFGGTHYNVTAFRTARPGPY